MKVQIKVPKKPAWHKATDANVEEFKHDMETRLAARPVPAYLSCEDPHCSDPAHTDERHRFMLDIMCSALGIVEIFCELTVLCTTLPVQLQKSKSSKISCSVLYTRTQSLRTRRLLEMWLRKQQGS